MVSGAVQAAKQAEGFELIHPHDRHGKTISDRYCTRAIEQALDDYRYACDAARVAVRNQLKSLADTLQVLCFAVPCRAISRAKPTRSLDLLTSISSSFAVCMTAFRVPCSDLCAEPYICPSA